jgi:YD repeat-containing protein
MTFAAAGALICSYGPAGFAGPTSPKDELVGPVRTVTTKALGHTETETYDQAGNLVEAVIHLEHGDTSTHYLFHYDSQGNLLEEVALDPSGKLIYRKRFGYARDGAGRETASVAVSDEGEFLYAEFSLYDRFGNLSEQLLVHGATAHRSLFDVLGRVIYSARYNNGALASELRHRYDERGRLKELASYNADGIMTGRVVNDHDAAGRRVRATTEQFHAGGARTWITTYDYDAVGNWIREVTVEEVPAGAETGTTRTPTVQERVIDYYAGPQDNPQ